MIFWISPEGDGVALARRIHLEGHPIALFLADPWNRAKLDYRGLCPQVMSLQEGIDLHPDVVVIDSSGRRLPGLGVIADWTFKPLTPVVGSARICDMVEVDRGFGKEVMVKHGIRIPVTFIFDPQKGFPIDQEIRRAESGQSLLHVQGHLAEAKRVVEAFGGRWVLKPFHQQASSEVLVAHTPEEMLEHIDDCAEKDTIPPDKPFLIERFIKGIEISTEAWFHRGRLIPGSVNGMMETKKFMPGDYGPNTGAQTSVMWGYDRTPRIFAETFGTDTFLSWMLAPVGPDGERLAPYTGPWEITAIISDEDHKPYGLEWGPRWGYNSSYAEAELWTKPISEIVLDVALGRGPMRFKPGFGYAIQVSIPPFPGSEELHKLDERIHAGAMKIAEGIDIDGPVDSPHVWLLDARITPKGNLETAGVDAVVMNITGYGLTVEQARDPAHMLVERIELEDKQARITDGADRAIRDLARLEMLGYDVPRKVLVGVTP